jgi:hypothetical protein
MIRTPGESARTSWTMRSAVFTDVTEIEALRQVEVELNGAQLPWTADRVLHDQINLRAVKGAVGFIDLVGNP